MTSIPDRIRAEAQRLGFEAVGVTAPRLAPRNQARLDRFVAAGEYGTMGWMADTHARRRDPKTLWAAVRSVVVLGANYAPAEDPMVLRDHPERAAISVYARNKDYHDLLKKRAKHLARWMVARFDCGVKVFVDTAPVMEKPLAEAAGIGWQGKHTNLVSRAFGSWLFLAEIFTTLDLAPDPPGQDRCGRCRACQDVCPTDAFPAPYRLDARRCLSYLTIEHDGPIPTEFRAALGNRIYGCDDCLAVCPWNKFAQATREMAFLPRVELTAPRLADFLDLDEDGFRALFSGSPIKRIRRRRFLRNVLIALGNSGQCDLVDRIAPLLGDTEALIRGAAVWAVARLADPDMLARLRSRYRPGETDPAVIAEWTASSSICTVTSPSVRNATP